MMNKDLPEQEGNQTKDPETTQGISKDPPETEDTNFNKDLPNEGGNDQVTHEGERLKVFRNRAPPS